MTVLPLVDEPKRLRATIDNGLLRVCRSPVVRDTDTGYRAIADILGHHEYEVVLDFSEPDPNMMYGEVRVTVYRLSQARGGPRSDSIVRGSRHLDSPR